jgi:hypothetical protein
MLAAVIESGPQSRQVENLRLLCTLSPTRRPFDAEEASRNFIDAPRFAAVTKRGAYDRHDQTLFHHGFR